MENYFNVSEIQVQFLPDFKPSERPSISKSSDAYKIFIAHWDAGLMQFLEEFKVLLLNNANRILGIVDISVGSKDAVMVDMRVIFSIALKASACKIILAHNHPSGKLEPSNADKAITTKAKEAGKVLDIEVCDHLIITPGGYYSFADNGELEKNIL